MNKFSLIVLSVSLLAIHCQAGKLLIGQGHAQAQEIKGHQETMIQDDGNGQQAQAPQRNQGGQPNQSAPTNKGAQQPVPAQRGVNHRSKRHAHNGNANNDLMDAPANQGAHSTGQSKPKYHETVAQPKSKPTAQPKHSVESHDNSAQVNQQPLQPSGAQQEDSIKACPNQGSQPIQPKASSQPHQEAEQQSQPSPETSQETRPVAAEPKQVAAEPQSQPAAAEQQPQPSPETSQETMPVAAEPKPQPVHEEPKQIQAEPQSAHEQPKPVVAESQPSPAQPTPDAHPEAETQASPAPQSSQAHEPVVETHPAAEPQSAATLQQQPGEPAHEPNEPAGKAVPESNSQVAGPESKPQGPSSESVLFSTKPPQNTKSQIEAEHADIGQQQADDQDSDGKKDKWFKIHHNSAKNQGSQEDVEIKQAQKQRQIVYLEKDHQ